MTDSIQPRGFLLCGPAFSGKTTLARALVARGFVHISLDEILVARGLDPGAGLAVAHWEAASDEAYDQIRAAGRTRSEFVLDDTLCYRFLRDRYRDCARAAGFKTRLVVLSISDDEVIRRTRVNARQRLRRGLRETVLREHLATFEWPGADEDAVIVQASDPVEVQLSKLGIGP